MIEIRAFSEEHASATATLFYRAMRGRKDQPSEALQDYFCEVLLENPWATPEIPPLVALEAGKVIGVLGVVPRPMKFREQKILVATLTQHMVDPDHRRSTAAMDLLRTCFQGPQDMTWVDGASDPLHLFHRPFGSLPAPFYSLHWIRIIRPFGTGRDFLTRFDRVGRILHWASGMGASAGDLLGSRLPGFRLPDTPFAARQASAEEIFSLIEDIGWREPLAPDYDLASFRWLITQATQAESFGRLQMRIVQDAAGRECGWLVYFANPGGSAYLLQLGRRRADQFEAILHAFLRDAWEAGCALAKGLARPEHLTPLTKNYCLLRHPQTYALIHSRNPDLLNIVRCGDAALSGLDGERWQRFAAESWEAKPAGRTDRR